MSTILFFFFSFGVFFFGVNYTLALFTVSRDTYSKKKRNFEAFLSSTSNTQVLIRRSLRLCLFDVSRTRAIVAINCTRTQISCSVNYRGMKRRCVFLCISILWFNRSAILYPMVFQTFYYYGHNL